MPRRGENWPTTRRRASSDSGGRGDPHPWGEGPRISPPRGHRVAGRVRHRAEQGAVATGDHTCPGDPTCVGGTQEALTTEKQKGEMCACLLVFLRIDKKNSLCQVSNVLGNLTAFMNLCSLKKGQGNCLCQHSQLHSESLGKPRKELSCVAAAFKGTFGKSSGA